MTHAPVRPVDVPRLAARLALATSLALLFAGATAARAAQDCELNGQPVNPANGGETARKTGVLRCKDPHTGRVMRESTYDSGQELGLARTFHPHGRLRRAAYRADRGGERAVAEFNARGQLIFLRCADKPLLEPAVDDRPERPPGPRPPP